MSSLEKKRNSYFLVFLTEKLCKAPNFSDKQVLCFLMFRSSLFLDH